MVKGPNTQKFGTKVDSSPAASGDVEYWLYYGRANTKNFIKSIVNKYPETIVRPVSSGNEFRKRPISVDVVKNSYNMERCIYSYRIRR